jgi:hypothetical protein
LIAGKRYVCARRAVIRRSFEIDGDKTGTLERDTVVEVLEERQNKQGTIRVHFTQGWVSKTTAAGLVVLEDEKESCDADSRAHAAESAVFCAPSARKQEPLDGGAVGTQIAIGAVPRYCKKCKLVFSTTACPGGHANFMYTKTLPTWGIKKTKSGVQLNPRIYHAIYHRDLGDPAPDLGDLLCSSFDWWRLAISAIEPLLAIACSISNDRATTSL